MSFAAGADMMKSIKTNKVQKCIVFLQLLCFTNIKKSSSIEWWGISYIVSILITCSFTTCAYNLNCFRCNIIYLKMSFLSFVWNWYSWFFGEYHILSLFFKPSAVKGCLVVSSQADNFYLSKCFVIFKIKDTEDIFCMEISLEANICINEIYKHENDAIFDCHIPLAFQVNKLI